MTSKAPRSLYDYIQAARRRGVTLLLPALVLAVATGIALVKLPTVYESRARILIDSPPNDSAHSAINFDELRKQLASREILGAVIRKFDLAAAHDDALAQMRSRINFEADAVSKTKFGAFLISYRATDPESARRVVDELAAQVIARSLKPVVLATATSALRKQSDQISLQLHELEQKSPWLVGMTTNLPGIAAAQPASSRATAEETRAQRMSIESLRDQQYKIQQELVDFDARINTQRQIVEQQKKGSTLRDNPTYAVLIARRAELQGQRDTLINRQELTDKHPRVLAINDQISAINRQIEELRQQDSTVVSQSPEARELAALQSQRNRLKIDLEVSGRELARRAATPEPQPSAPRSAPVRRDQAGSKLAQEYIGLKRALADVTSELKDSDLKMNSSDERNIPPLHAEPASSPSRAILRRGPLVIAITALAGLALGAIFAILAESRRARSLHSAKDVEYYTRLPMLVAIPRTLTRKERSRARWRSAGRVALTSAISASVTLAFAKVLIVSNLLTYIAGN